MIIIIIIWIWVHLHRVFTRRRAVLAKSRPEGGCVKKRSRAVRRTPIDGARRLGGPLLGLARAQTSIYKVPHTPCGGEV